MHTDVPVHDNVHSVDYSVGLCVMHGLDSLCACLFCVMCMSAFTTACLPCTVDGGIAALPPPEHFCRSCHQDFSKEHEDYKIEYELPEGMIEAKEQSNIPKLQEMVVP